MDEKPGDVPAIDALSAYLKAPKSAHERLVPEGEVPWRGVGGHWRFRKGAAGRWLEELHGDRKDACLRRRGASRRRQGRNE